MLCSTATVEQDPSVASPTEDVVAEHPEQSSTDLTHSPTSHEHKTLTQDDEGIESSQRWLQKRSFIGLPGIFYSPETRLGLGLGAQYTFDLLNNPDPNSRPSFVQVGLAVTQEQQVIGRVLTNVFWGDTLFEANTGYAYYVYRYFGQGNRTRIADEEIYTAANPWFLANLLHRFAPGFYAGVAIDTEDRSLVETEADGLLSTEQPLGAQGGFVSSLGLLARLDTRDHLFFPTRGVLTQLRWLHHSPWFGSDYAFDRLDIEASHYRHLGVLKNDVLAMKLTAAETFGNAPFWRQPELGGNRLMRGYWQGRFRDNAMWAGQLEYRLPLFWRVGVAAFANAGSVAQHWDRMFEQKVHFGWGGGFRALLSKKDKINARLDFGVDEVGTVYTYVFFGEAF